MAREVHCWYFWKKGKKNYYTVSAQLLLAKNNERKVSEETEWV